MIDQINEIQPFLRAYSESKIEPIELPQPRPCLLDSGHTARVQRLVKVGLAIYDWIKSVDEEWGCAVREGQKQFSIEDAKQIRGAYEWWLSPCDKVMQRIKEAKNRGSHIDNYDAFFSACREAKLKVAFDIDRLESSLKQLDGGKGRPLSEVKDELRRRYVG
jgi:hypothetical protein